MEYKREIRKWTVDFSVSIVNLTKELQAIGVPLSLNNQLLRAGTSIGANVHEGKASSSEKELVRYLAIALRSANETKYWLSVIREAFPVRGKVFSHCENELKNFKKCLQQLSLSLKISELR